MRIDGPEALERLDFDKAAGLVAVVAQDAVSGRVLMQAWANREALERTLSTGDLWLWSRSRASLWKKGETSGNVQRLVSLHGDCDGDTVLALVLPAGPACHTGARTCFEAPDDDGAAAAPPAPTFPALADVLRRRAREGGESSYTARLLRERNLRLKKLGEEAVELAVALADGDVERAREEAADVLYHVLAACLAEGIQAEDVLRGLEGRLDRGPDS